MTVTPRRRDGDPGSCARRSAPISAWVSASRASATTVIRRFHRRAIIIPVSDATRFRAGLATLGQAGASLVGPGTLVRPGQARRPGHPLGDLGPHDAVDAVYLQFPAENGVGKRFIVDNVEFAQSLVITGVAAAVAGAPRDGAAVRLRPR